MQLQPQQEIVELGDKGPVGEDVAESVGQPGCWCHHCGVQDAKYHIWGFQAGVARLSLQGGGGGMEVTGLGSRELLR